MYKEYVITYWLQLECHCVEWICLECIIPYDSQKYILVTTIFKKKINSSYSIFGKFNSFLFRRINLSECVEYVEFTIPLISLSFYPISSTNPFFYFTNDNSFIPNISFWNKQLHPVKTLTEVVWSQLQYISMAIKIMLMVLEL